MEILRVKFDGVPTHVVVDEWCGRRREERIRHGDRARRVQLVVGSLGLLKAAATATLQIDGDRERQVSLAFFARVVAPTQPATDTGSIRVEVDRQQAQTSHVIVFGANTSTVRDRRRRRR